MASTVKLAFEEFLRNKVQLDAGKITSAQASLDSLINNINTFSGDKDFFKLLPNRHLKYGSFTRNTKPNPLDDIDLMICLSAEGRKYSVFGNTYYITKEGIDDSNEFIEDKFYHFYNDSIDSKAVIRQLILKLKSISDYEYAELHKNQEAATLKLKLFDWNFDIVPCWYMDIDKYLIPDGSGKWKLTDPRIDNQRIERINKMYRGKLLDVIRIMKYWNNRELMIDSYLLECMILAVYEKNKKVDRCIYLELRNLLNTLSNMILGEINDPKGIQGNLNTLPENEKNNCSRVLSAAYLKACNAIKFERVDKDQKAAIEKWREVFGNDFPEFS